MSMVRAMSLRSKARFGAALCRARERRGMTQRELGEKAGIAESWVSNLERGQRLPSFAVLVRLALALGVSADDLLSLS